jgi:HEAT repeat protein
MRRLILILLLAISPPLTAAEPGWVQWWEANRHVYLKPPAGREPSLPQLVALRDAATPVLLKATRHRDAAVRAEAAIALGRIAAKDAVERLIELTGDDNVDVRIAAWLALGMHGNPDARDHILTPRDVTEPQLMAWIAALGLMEEPTDRGLGALMWFLEHGGPRTTSREQKGVFGQTSDLWQRLLNDRATNAQRMAMWALRVQEGPRLRNMMREILEHDGATYPAIEAIMTLGAAADPRDIDLLCKIYLLFNDGRDLPVVHRLFLLDQGIPSGFSLPITGVPLDRWPYGEEELHGVRNAAALALASYPTDIVRKHLARPLLSDQERYPELPTNTTYARRHIPYAKVEILRSDAPDIIDPPIINRFTQHIRDDSPVYRHGMISLGLIAHEDDLPRLMEMTEIARVASPRERAEHTRGVDRHMAAIALGLALRRLEQVQHDDQLRFAVARRNGNRAPVLRNDIQDRQRGINDAFERLVEIINDATEPPSMRAATALALGLTGREEAATVLVSAASTFSKQDILPLGYTTVALALLEDDRAARGARALIGEPEDELDLGRMGRGGLDDKLSLDDILAGRAAVAALGSIEHKDAEALLLTAFGRELFISREAARGLRRRGDINALARSMIELMPTEDMSPKMRVMALWTLGELLDRHDPPLMRRFTDGCNYTFPRRQRPTEYDWILHFRSLAQPLLYGRLLE